MKTIIVFFLLQFIFIGGCNESNKQFARKKELYTYMSNIQSVDLSKFNGYVFILQTGFCGACADEVVSFIDRHFSNDNASEKIFLFTNKRPNIEKLMSSYPQSRVLTDHNFMAEKYGLVYTSDLIFRFSGGEVTYWSLLSNKTFDKIEKEAHLKMD